MVSVFSVISASMATTPMSDNFTDTWIPSYKVKHVLCAICQDLPIYCGLNLQDDVNGVEHTLSNYSPRVFQHFSYYDPFYRLGAIARIVTKRLTPILAMQLDDCDCDDTPCDIHATVYDKSSSV